jgi:hypothetical protein
MNLTLSPQLRIVAAVGLLAMLGLPATLMLAGREQASSPANTVVRAQRPEAPARPAPTKPVRPPATPSKPKENPAVAAALRTGLPRGIAEAFADRDVVVVALYSGVAPLDRLAYTEAEAGAVLAGAGFVPVDVVAGEDPVARSLVTKLGIRQAPTVLVFARPGTLSLRIDGFVDHETVAQAATNARPA